ncbi:hypothetical protein CANCADRAFT_44700 [Tortispora caseinolytica NRRL Y-17796]|uniref:FHA domain-containing protein n=1 Tax=Tortispora caseinolytica NRRL Y-17796 TaxID=767744 RepID=A0A1E4TH65_9ASCO|nr:hypothetical protein CANCADRAFT_44700 [Tortispora caseinolytica NRRL Y-17796]
MAVATSSSTLLEDSLVEHTLGAVPDTPASMQTDTNLNGSDSSLNKPLNSPVKLTPAEHALFVHHTNTHTDDDELDADTSFALVFLHSLNDTFQPKCIKVPAYPSVCKLGRQISAQTVPSPTNGFFDTRVLSRNHATLSFDPASNTVFIKDANSANGTFVNGNKLSSSEKADGTPLGEKDALYLGIDIQADTSSGKIHKRIAAVVSKIITFSAPHHSAASQTSKSNPISYASPEMFSDEEVPEYDISSYNSAFQPSLQADLSMKQALEAPYAPLNLAPLLASIQDLIKRSHLQSIEIKRAQQLLERTETKRKPIKDLEMPYESPVPDCNGTSSGENIPVSNFSPCDATNATEPLAENSMLENQNLNAVSPGLDSEIKTLKRRVSEQANLINTLRKQLQDTQAEKTRIQHLLEDISLRSKELSSFPDPRISSVSVTSAPIQNSTRQATPTPRVSSTKGYYDITRIGHVISAFGIIGIGIGMVALFRDVPLFGEITQNS